MTNLDMLRRLPAAQMAQFLAEQRMQAVRLLLEDHDNAEEIEDKIAAMFYEWLRKECE